MKLNNKGFAISGVLYSLLILFITLFIGILTILATTKFSLDKVKNDITDKLENLAYRDTILNGADPVLKEGMIPVTIDADGTVKKADITKAWYDYDNKLWANAVVLDDNYQSLHGSGNVNGTTRNNGYVSFDGDDDYISLGHENYDFGNSITYAMRLKVNSTAISDRDTTDDFIETYPTFLNHFENAGGGLIIVDNKFALSLWIEELGRYHDLVSDVEVEIGKWYTIAGTYDGDAMKLYVDGVLAASENIEGTILESPVHFSIGANYNIDGGYFEHSNIDVAQADVYSRTLNSEEIKKGYSKEIKVQNNEGLLIHVDFSNKTYDNGEIIPEDKISQYYTWIPRYRYKLWHTQATDGDNGYVNDTKVHSINIIFESKNTAKSAGTRNGQYLTHPAFTFGDEELNGIWVGKFETGYNGATTTTDAEVSTADSAKVIIKPKVYSWRNINVSDMFYTALNMNDDNNVFGLNDDSDTHMMKNIEWGAVTYLAYAKYGKDSEVYNNNDNTYLTGCGGNIAYDSGITRCLNGYGTKTDNIYNQSTTGNISGIFDMNGGAEEHVMGYTTGATVKYGDSGFSDATFPEDKYVDIYSSNDSFQYTNRKLGDATGEMGPFSVDIADNFDESLAYSSWYSDYAYFVYEERPWFSRGGYHSHKQSSGLAHFCEYYGHNHNNFSFRIVLV